VITIVFSYLIFLLVLFRWDNSVELEQNSEAATVADHLFKELKTFVIPEGLQLKTSVLEAYTYLATRSKPKIDHAMQIFIDILEKEKDYLPALLGMSTTFMLEKSTTKARNALKRIAKMPYSHELADDFERGYLLLADIYIQKSKFDLSEDLCNRCLKYNLSCGRAWETMGVIREKEASYKDAADMYEKVSWSPSIDFNTSVRDVT
jgi:tetratricopeptide repeat protein 21B